MGDAVMANKAMVVFLLQVFISIAKPGSSSVVQFIFGDSLLDVGNNNRLTKSLARPNLPWYGIDFGDGLPNGRFTNGRTVADITGDKLGYPRPPAFLDPSVDENVILKNGLSYASGGGGILNDTSSFFVSPLTLIVDNVCLDESGLVQRFSLYKQIELFQGTKALITRKIGSEAAEEFFREASYVVSMGSNDFINNFLLPNPWLYTDSTATKFIDLLMMTLRDQLKLLHSLGARKLMLFGLGPLGCIPLQRILSASGGCLERTNRLAEGFNRAASQLMSGLSRALPNATFDYGDAYDVTTDMIANPTKYGLRNSDKPCCTVGRIRPSLTCTPVSSLCRERSQYVFWDEYHPTDRANEIIADQIISKLGHAPVNGK